MVFVVFERKQKQNIHEIACEIEAQRKILLTCRWNASGIVNVLEIQQNVFTTCVGTPLTMHAIGWPTYCVAVMTRLQVSNSTVVNTLCKRNTALSICTSCCLKYSFNPPNNLYMIDDDDRCARRFAFIYLFRHQTNQFALNTNNRWRYSSSMLIHFIIVSTDDLALQIAFSAGESNYLVKSFWCFCLFPVQTGNFGVAY